MDISQLSIGKKIYIYIKEEQNLDTNFELTSQVVDILNQDEFVIDLPFYRNNAVELRVKDQIIVNFTHNNGLFMFEGECIEEINESKVKLYKIHVTTEVKRIQRRDYFRVLINTPIVYRYMVCDKEVYGQGTIKDLSGGGLKFICDEEMELNSIINIFLRLKQDMEIRTEVKIIRCNLIEPGKYEVSILFHKLSFKQREILIKYIFDIQRDNLRKK